jgi:ribosomal protein S18 acetylase RimI-like enzyme
MQMDHSSLVQFEVKQSPTEEDVAAVRNGALWAFNVAQTGDGDLQHLVIHVVTDTGAMIGGLVGTYLWGWLHIETVIIAESFRQQGVGTQLMRAAEIDARQRGYRNIYLETMSFQARPFYERMGYEVFGTLDDFPPGHQQYFMRKTLTA